MRTLDTIEYEEYDKIDTTIATFRHFTTDSLITDAAVLFWESHTDNTTDRKRIQATSDLIYKTFDISTCEAIEVRTGYLSRYNFLEVDADKATEKDWEKAVIGGIKSEKAWVQRCEPHLPGFRLQEWTESISPEYNPYYDQCRSLLCDEILNNGEFKAAFYEGINDYADRHNSNKVNGSHYMLEEMAWIFSLMLVYWNKPVYLIHVGNDNPGIRDMFKLYPHLAKTVKWLSPKCRDSVEFRNLANFLMYYRCNTSSGFSFAVEHRDIMARLSQRPTYEQRRIA